MDCVYTLKLKRLCSMLCCYAIVMVPSYDTMDDRDARFLIFLYALHCCYAVILLILQAIVEVATRASGTKSLSSLAHSCLNRERSVLNQSINLRVSSSTVMSRDYRHADGHRCSTGVESSLLTLLDHAST